MAVDIKEGEIGSAYDAIVFPNINSCLSITCICGGSLVGGHAVLIPEKGQLPINDIVDGLALRSATCLKLFIIGDNTTWNNNLKLISNKYTSIQSIVNKLKPKSSISNAAGYKPVVTHDIYDWLKGKSSVDIEFSLTNRKVTVWKRVANTRTATIFLKEFF